MQVSSLSPITLISQQQDSKNTKTSENFSNYLNNAINKLNEIQLNADQEKIKFITGEVQDIHQVTIAMQEAKIAMGIAVEVRNKVVEAYQEISRMPL